MSKVCETAFFAATKSGADVFVPKGAVFADDHPIVKGRDAHFLDVGEAEQQTAVQLNAPDGTPGFPRVEDDGTVTLGPGTTLDPTGGTVAHAGETYYTLDRAAEVLVELQTALGLDPSSAADGDASSSDASSDAGTTPPAPSSDADAKPSDQSPAQVAKKTAAKKVAAKR